MTAREWLKLVCSYNAALNARDLQQHATRLMVEFPARAFEQATARKVADGLVLGAGIDDLTASLRHHIGQTYLKQHRDEAEIMGDAWRDYIARRLGKGADRAHLLSLLRAYSPPNALRQSMADLFPAELAAQDEYDREVARDKARAIAAAKAIAAKVTRASAMPQPHGAKVKTRPAEAKPPRFATMSDADLATARAAAGVQTSKVQE
jgi:hypothetical protein